MEFKKQFKNLPISRLKQLRSKYNPVSAEYKKITELINKKQLELQIDKNARNFLRMKKEDKLKVMRAYLEMVREVISHNEKIIKRLEKQIREDSRLASKIQEYLENKDFDKFYKEIYKK